jgi:hypothetical protein
MEPYALVASSGRHRGPAWSAVDRGPSYAHLLGRRQSQRHVAGRLPFGELSRAQPCRLHPKFCPRVGADSRLLRTCVCGCPVVTTGDLV